MAIRKTLAVLQAEIRRHRSLSRFHDAGDAPELAARHRRMTAVLEQALLQIEEVERDEDGRDYQSEGRRG